MFCLTVPILNFLGMLPSRGQAATEKKKRCAFAEFSWLAKDALLDHDDKNEKYNYHEKDAPITTEKAITIAAFFLMDYEAGRAPTLSSYFHRITDHQLNVYRLEFSSWWRWIGLYPATFLLFVTYFQSRIWTTIFHVYAVLILLVDLYLRHSLLSPQWHLNDERKMERNVHAAMLVFLIVLGIQSCLWFLWAHPEDHLSTMVTALFKPLVFFYLSRRARDALEALIKIGKIIARVILIELFLILTFAAVACRLYYNDDGFQSLAKSWLSLFQCKRIHHNLYKMSTILKFTSRSQYRRRLSIRVCGCPHTLKGDQMQYSLSYSSSCVSFTCTL